MTEISMSKTDRKNLDDLFERFIKHSKSKNLSEATIHYYQANFRRFREFLDDHYKENIKFADDIDREVIESFRLYLLEKDISNYSINAYLRAVRVFLNYAMELGFTEEFKIELVKAENKIKSTYTDEEIEKLLEKPDLNNCNFAEYRTWVMVNWFLSTGNRARSVRNIKIKDLNLNDGHVKLRKVKNRSERIIPLPQSLVEILIEYLQIRDGNEDDYLFCTIYGDKLAKFSINTAIRKYNKDRGIDKTSTHLFRHSFAKLWIKNGGDVFRLQKILGHKSMEMVRNYVNMYGEDLKDDFEEYNPLNNFKNNKAYISMDE